MNLTLSLPPKLTGDTERDIAKIHEWCTALQIQLKRIIFAVNDSINEALSISADTSDDVTVSEEDTSEENTSEEDTSEEDTSEEEVVS